MTAVRAVRARENECDFRIPRYIQVCLVILLLLLWTTRRAPSFVNCKYIKLLYNNNKIRIVFVWVCVHNLNNVDKCCRRVIKSRDVSRRLQTTRNLLYDVGAS